MDLITRRIARERGLKIIKICGYSRFIPEKGIFDAGPSEFVNLISSSEYIVTNSFHGTALALIFEKNFNVVLPRNRKARLTDLLMLIGQESRICQSSSIIDTSPINYAAIKPILDNYIRFSKQYIDSIIQSSEVDG